MLHLFLDSPSEGLLRVFPKAGTLTLNPNP